MPITEDRKQTFSLSAAWDGTVVEPTGTTATMDCAGCSIASFHLVGTFTATITWEVSNTGAVGQWVAVMATNSNTGVEAATSAGAGATNAIYLIPVAGYRLVRGRCSAFTSGPVPVYSRCSTGDSASAAAAGGGGGGGGGTVTWVDANSTQATAVAQEQRVASDGMILDAGGNAMNRIRSVKDAIVGVGGGAIPSAGIVGLQGSTFLPVLLDANQSARVVAGGYTTILNSTLTRPADTNVYAAGDEMSSSTTAPAVNTITGAGRQSGGTGVIKRVVVAQDTLWTVRPVLELWIFNTTTTPNNDNAAFAPADADVATCIGVISIGSSYLGTVNQLLDSGPVDLPFKCVGSANLFFRVVVRNAGQDSANSGVSVFRFSLFQD